MFAHGSLISKIILVNLISIFLIIVFLFIVLILVINLFYFLIRSAKIRLKDLSSIEHQFFLTVCIGAPFELTFTILLKPFAKHCFVVGRLNTRGNLGFVGLCRACWRVLWLYWNHWILNLGLVLLWKRLVLFLVQTFWFLTIFLQFFKWLFIILPVIFQVLQSLDFFCIDIPISPFRLLWRITIIMIIRSECKYWIVHYWLLYTFCTSILHILRLNYYFIFTFITWFTYILVTWVYILINVLLMDFLCNFWLYQFLLVFITETTLFKLSFL